MCVCITQNSFSLSLSSFSSLFTFKVCDCHHYYAGRPHNGMQECRQDNGREERDTSGCMGYRRCREVRYQLRETGGPLLYIRASCLPGWLGCLSLDAPLMPLWLTASPHTYTWEAVYLCVQPTMESTIGLMQITVHIVDYLHGSLICATALSQSILYVVVCTTCASGINLNRYMYTFSNNVGWLWANSAY